MTEERITTVETPAGDSHTTHTTVIDDGARSGGGSGWLIGLVLIVALIAGFYFFTQMNQSNAAKNNAIAGAANDIGKAAKDAGAAATDAVDELKKK